MRKVATVAGILAVTVSPLMADFTYQEKSTITGGALAGIMKVAGVFSKAAREPLQTTVSVKGDRMVSRGATHMSIIDLNAQTITSVDIQKKTYTVMTFEQMKQMMEQMQQSMQNAKNKNGDNVQMSFKVSATNPGNTKQVNGYDAREMILKMEMQGTDTDSGQKGSMVITTDMWIAPAVSGYGEVREFHKRMAERLNWTPNGNMFASRPDVAQGMAEVYKEVGKLDGMAVMQTIVMGAEGQPDGQQQPQSQTQPPPQQQQSAERPSLSGALGGMLGVRKSKKSSSDPPPDASKTNSQPGSLLEMTTEMSGFSSGPVDEGQFTVPGNFKKVDAPARR